MDATTRASALFIAVGVAVAGLYFFRDILAPLALAVFLWLTMDGFANGLRGATRDVMPRPLALAIAVVVVLAGAAASVAVITDSATEFARQSPQYVRRVDEVIAQLYAMAAPEAEPPTISRFLSDVQVGRFFRQLAATP